MTKGKIKPGNRNQNSEEGGALDSVVKYSF